MLWTSKDGLGVPRGRCKCGNCKLFQRPLLIDEEGKPDTVCSTCKCPNTNHKRMNFEGSILWRTGKLEDEQGDFNTTIDSIHVEPDIVIEEEEEKHNTESNEFGDVTGVGASAPPVKVEENSIPENSPPKMERTERVGKPGVAWTVGSDEPVSNAKKPVPAKSQPHAKEHVEQNSDQDDDDSDVSIEFEPYTAPEDITGEKDMHKETPLSYAVDLDEEPCTPSDEDDDDEEEEEEEEPKPNIKSENEGEEEDEHEDGTEGEEAETDDTNVKPQPNNRAFTSKRSSEPEVTGPESIVFTHVKQWNTEALHQFSLKRYMGCIGRCKEELEYLDTLDSSYEIWKVPVMLVEALSNLHIVQSRSEAPGNDEISILTSIQACVSVAKSIMARHSESEYHKYESMAWTVLAVVELYFGDYATVQKYFSSGRSAHARGYSEKYDLNLPRIDDLLKLDVAAPGLKRKYEAATAALAAHSVELLLLKGNALLQQRNVEEVLKVCTYAQSMRHLSETQLFKFVFLESMCLYHMGSLEEALGLLERQPSRSFSEEERSSFQTMRQMLDGKSEGNKHFKNGNVDKAIEAYTQTLKLDPLNKKMCAILYCNRAAAYMKKGLFEKAVADCDCAIQRDVLYQKAVLRRATAGKQCNSIQYWRKAKEDFIKLQKMQNSTDYASDIEELKKRINTRPAKPKQNDNAERPKSSFNARPSTQRAQTPSPPRPNTTPPPPQPQPQSQQSKPMHGRYKKPSAGYTKTDAGTSWKEKQDAHWKEWNQNRQRTGTRNTNYSNYSNFNSKGSANSNKSNYGGARQQQSQNSGRFESHPEWLNKGKVKDFYSMLGLNKFSNDRTAIKKAFHKMALRYHPDKHSDDLTEAQSADMETKFKNATEAYSVLKDDTIREQYDRFLKHF